MYFIAFIYLWSQWSSAPTPPGGVGSSNMQSAIIFSFFSLFTWVCIFNDFFLMNILKILLFFWFLCLGSLCLFGL